jgi:hypothetical protein
VRRCKEFRPINTSRVQPATAAAVAGVVILYLLELLVANNYITHFGYGPAGLSKSHSAVMLLAAVIQTALLYLIYRRSTEQPNGMTAFVAVGAAIMAGASFFAVCAQGDAFAYISYAKLGLSGAVYARHVPFHPVPGFESMWINLPPCVYGPLWVLQNWLTLGWVPNLAVAFFILRLCAIVLIAVIAFALRKLDANTGTIAVTLLNPFLYF